MLYQIMDGTLAAGGEIVLEHFDFEIRGQDKIAVVGPNGAGKTTLLRLIAGELTLERDDRRGNPGVRLSKNVTVGILHQQAFSETDKTVEEEIMSICPAIGSWDRERFEFEQAYDRLFTGFGFTKADKKRRLSEFSGGQQTRIALIRLLLMEPDILLLDEPTNHLDMETVEWLEHYLSVYPKAVVIVSHDRFFLDRTADIVYELAGKKLIRYTGNYTSYKEQKQKRLAAQRKAWDRQQAEIDRLERLIDRFKNKPKKAAFARSRKKLLERMGKLPMPESSAEHLFTGDLLPAVTGGKWVLETEKLKIGYDRALPLADLSLRIRRGQKIGVIGPNGAGKSTFLKTAAGILPPLGGKCQTGIHVEIGYFDQHSANQAQEGFPDEIQVLERFRRKYPSMNEKELRHYLAAYLFRGADVYKQFGQLSGGERSRLVLAEILAARPNFLILDEPTNHMDIPAKETLESAFRAYRGTLLFVSHDRYFIEQVADALLIFDGGNVLYYPFGYRHYLERRQRLMALAEIHDGDLPRIRGGSLSGCGVYEKEQSGDNDVLAAGIRAEDQALIASLQSVPRGASLLGKEISTEQAFLEWQLRLAAEAMETAEKKALAQMAAREAQRQQDYLCWAGAVHDGGISSGMQMPDAALAAWQAAILDWYDIWQELHTEGRQ